MCKKQDNKTATPYGSDTKSPAGPSGYLEGGNSSDLPPAYSVSDPNATGSGSGSNQPAVASSSDAADEIKTVRKSAGEIVATRDFGFDRPLFITTTSISSSHLVIEPDGNLANTDGIRVVVEVTSKLDDLQEKCKVSAHVNKQGEYELNVTSLHSMWTFKSVNCRFFVKIPKITKATHPGIRVELNKGRIDASYVDNVCFNKLGLKTSSEVVTVNNVNANEVSVATSSSEVTCTNSTVNGTLHVDTTSGKVTLDGINAGNVGVRTRNGKIYLHNVKSGDVRGETTNNNIKCERVTAAGKLDLRTCNTSIATTDTSAGSLLLNTTNSSLEGTWTVRELLDIATTNSKIEATVVLEDPMSDAYIRMVTSNSKIKATLPASTFRGTFDARTCNSSVRVYQPNEKSGVPKVPVSYIIDDKAYKRGTIGNSDETKHQFLANTLNSDIEIYLN